MGWDLSEMWGGVGQDEACRRVIETGLIRREYKKGSPGAALASVLALFLEAAAEPVFHATGEGTTGALATALTRAR